MKTVKDYPPPKEVPLGKPKRKFSETFSALIALRKHFNLEDKTK